MNKRFLKRKSFIHKQVAFHVYYQMLILFFLNIYILLMGKMCVPMDKESQSPRFTNYSCIYCYAAPLLASGLVSWYGQTINEKSISEALNNVSLMFTYRMKLRQSCGADKVDIIESVSADTEMVKLSQVLQSHSRDKFQIVYVENKGM